LIRRFEEPQNDAIPFARQTANYCLSLKDIIPEAIPVCAPRIGNSRNKYELENGGASRARTDGLVVANDALSQLSYSPMNRMDWFILPAFLAPHHDVC
jgi:hypothetical protein